MTQEITKYIADELKDLPINIGHLTISIYSSDNWGAIMMRFEKEKVRYWTNHVGFIKDNRCYEYANPDFPNNLIKHIRKEGVKCIM